MSTVSPPRHVALLVETSNAYARGILTGIREFAAKRPGWSLYLEEHGRQETDTSWLEGWKVDGVLARIENEDTAQAIRRLGLPTVDLSAKRLIPELPCVETDDVQMAAWAVDHFAERGLHHFAYCGDERYGWSLGRAAAFTANVRGKKAVPHMFEMKPTGMRDHDRQRLMVWLRSLPKPVGILACYDIAGREVLETCRMAGLLVPDEVAVLGIDNDELFCNLTSPPLSSIQPDTLRTGFLAAQLLDEMMAGRDQRPGVRAIPPLRVAARQSSDVFSVADPLVSAALHYIRENSTGAITVSSVLRHVGLSRRALDYRFERLLGRTVHREIVRARMARVTDFLTSTDLPLSQIAERLGFRHTEYMGVMFKQHTGRAPGEYRALVRGSLAAYPMAGQTSPS